MRLAVLGSAVVAAILAAAVYLNARPESTLDRVRRTGVVRIGYAHEAPFAYRAQTGEVTGESAEIARIVVRSLGADRVEWVQTEFRALIPDLVAGRFDIIAAGMFVTPEREREIAFSTPTYAARAALLVRRGDEVRLGSYDRIREEPGARLAVLDGAYEAGLAAAARIPSGRILVVPDAVTGVAAVRTGRADALALTSLSIGRLAAVMTDGSVSPVVLPDTAIGDLRAVGRGAFGFRSEDGDLRDAFDAELRRFIGTPAHQAVARRFGFSLEPLETRLSAR